MTLSFLPLLGTGVGIVGLVITLLAYRRAPRSFYSDTPWLLPLGVFVWGDGLIMGPLWMGLGLLFWWLTPVEVVRTLCVVYGTRAAFEVVYWLNHQVAQRAYLPPLFRRVKWIGPQEAAILYQLLNMSQLIVAMLIFMLTWR